MDGSGLRPVDESFFSDHFHMWQPTFIDQMEDAIPFVLERCPVTWSDAFGGFWVVSSYHDIVQSYQDWRVFSSALERNITPLRPAQPVKPPIDLDPPLQRRYRQLLNPFLTPARLSRFEPWIRGLVTELIDGFIEAGQCDLAKEFAQALPGRMLYRLLFGIDDTDVPMVQSWLRQVNFDPTGPETPKAEEDFVSWIFSVIQQRRLGPRQDDIIDTLLHVRIEGVLLTDHQIMGTMYILTQGGFSTTAHAIGNIMARLAQDPALQTRLRDDPAFIPLAIDEFLRLDTPVTGQPRLCVRDTVLGGREIKAGDRLFMFLSAANRDPSEFEDPDRLDVDRIPNRHLAFGIGPHRCIGSNVVRLNLQIALEELLSRLADFRITPRDHVRRDPSPSWGPAYLPLTFTPGPKSSASQP